MKKTFTAYIIVSMFMITFGSAQGTAATDTSDGPEAVMARFIEAFIAGEYAACKSLLTEDATITITRREDGGPYNHSHQSAHAWLEEVGASGVKDIENFTIDIHQTTSQHHQHGATVTLKFTAHGGLGAYHFYNHGFDTGNLIETPMGWRILHYSSFEDFSLQEEK